MLENIKINTEFKKEKTVGIEDTAKAIGSGGLEVFSTPSLVALMELACKDFMDSFLPEGFSSVGIEISVKHLKATAVGEKVWCAGRVDEIDGKKIRFSLHCYDEKGKIGEGFHYRFVVDNEKFLKRLRENA